MAVSRNVLARSPNGLRRGAAAKGDKRGNCGDSAGLPPQLERLLGDAVLARVVANEVAGGNGDREDADAENGSDRHAGGEVAACAGITALHVAAASTSLRGALATKQSILSLRGKMDCFAEPVIGRAFARPVGSQ
jgi:hypothetical protein